MAITTTTLVAISKVTLLKAQCQIQACQACSQAAGLPFSWILDHVTERNPAITDYVMPEPARCTRCGGAVYETTLVEW